MDAQSAVLRDKAREYLRTRGTLATPAVIRERVGAAFAALGDLLTPSHPTW